MSLAPYQKISGDEIRQRTKQNRDNGEVEPGFETESDEPILFQHESAEAYQDHVLKQKMHALEMYRVTTTESSTDRQMKAEEFSFQQVEEESTVEITESKTEVQVEKGELLIGNIKELTFAQEKVEIVVAEEIKAETKTIAEQAPSSLSEFVGDVDFLKWGKKGLGSVFGFMKGLFGGLLNTVKESSKVEHHKTEAEQKAEVKKAKQNAEKNAFYQRTEKAVAEARGTAQNVISKVMVRLGLGGMGTDGMNAYLGENRNLNSEEVNVYTAFEVARKAEEAKKKQEKQVKDMQMAQSQGPTINIDAAVEGGTGGGKANMSAVSAGG